MPRSAHRAAALVLLNVALGALIPATVGAQRCMGTAPLNEWTGRAGVVGTHNERAQSVGATLGAGVTDALFVSGTFSRLWIDAAVDHVPAVSVSLGYGFDVNWPRDILAFHVCPLATFKSVDGPEVDLGPVTPRVYVKSHAYRGGLALGGAVLGWPSLSVMTTGSASFVREVARTRQAANEYKVSEDYGLLDGGIGVVIRHTFTVQGTASVPVAIRGLVPTYGIMLAMNFGRGFDPSTRRSIRTPTPPGAPPLARR